MKQSKALKEFIAIVEIWLSWIEKKKREKLWNELYNKLKKIEYETK